MLLTMMTVKPNWKGWTPLHSTYKLSRLVQQESEEVHTEITRASRPTTITSLCPWSLGSTVLPSAECSSLTIPQNYMNLDNNKKNQKKST